MYTLIITLFMFYFSITNIKICMHNTPVSTILYTLQRSPVRGDDDILRGVDVNAFYTQPRDQADGELSQTESQMHGANNRLPNGRVTNEGIYSLPHNHRLIALNSDDIDTRALYATPDKPKKLVVKDSDPQTLQIQKLNEQQEITVNLSDDALQRSMSSDHTGHSNETQAVLSALDAATAGEDGNATHTPRGVGNGRAGSVLDSPSRQEPYSHYDTIPAARSVHQSPSYSVTGAGAGARVIYPVDLSIGPHQAPVIYEDALGSPILYMDPNRQAQTLAYIDRTLAEENEIEYKFSSTVYVHTL